MILYNLLLNKFYNQSKTEKTINSKLSEKRKNSSVVCLCVIDLTHKGEIKRLFFKNITTNEELYLNIVSIKEVVFILKHKLSSMYLFTKEEELNLFNFFERCFTYSFDFHHTFTLIPQYITYDRHVLSLKINIL